MRRTNPECVGRMLQSHIPELQTTVKRKGKGKPIFPIVSKSEFFLSSLVGPDFWYCFKLFAITHDFLKKRASQWSDDEDFKKSKAKVQNVGSCCINHWKVLYKW